MSEKMLSLGLVDASTGEVLRHYKFSSPSSSAPITDQIAKTPRQFLYKDGIAYGAFYKTNYHFFKADMS